MTEPKLKVVFQEGCFDDFDGTPDELAEMIAELHRMAADGTIMDDATPLDDDQIEDLNEGLSRRELRQ
jgi:alkanesulfonate monooxygenase SsuD/methylene tetrahydromethanopterin reductase-like flavin-dependent oxidoreductase (luciferase family)